MTGDHGSVLRHSLPYVRVRLSYRTTLLALRLALSVRPGLLLRDERRCGLWLNQLPFLYPRLVI